MAFEDFFTKNLKLRRKKSFYFVTLFFFLTAPYTLKSEHSGIRPDTSSLVFLAEKIPATSFARSAYTQNFKHMLGTKNVRSANPDRHCFIFCFLENFDCLTITRLLFFVGWFSDGVFF